MLAPDTLIHQRYRITRHLAAGGMGSVYQATDERFGSTVALKQMTLTGNEVERAFAREAQLLNQLRHPALPRVTDYFSEQQGQFLVMDFVSGDDLARLKEHHPQPFALARVLPWLDQLLDALAYLHQRGIVHRDIKPQNLKLTDEGRIVLLDFGIARSATVTASMQAYTPQFAPPEQIQNQGTSPRSDLFSLAATGYFLLTAGHYQGTITRLMEIARQAPDPLPALHDVNPQVPLAVSTVLMQALTLYPDQRPADAATMRQMLQAAHQRNESPVSSPVPPPVPPASGPVTPTTPPPPTTPPRATSNPAATEPPARSGGGRWWAIAAMLLLVVVLGAGGGMLLMSRAPAASNPAQDSADPAAAADPPATDPASIPTAPPPPTALPTETPAEPPPEPASDPPAAALEQTAVALNQTETALIAAEQTAAAAQQSQAQQNTVLVLQQTEQAIRVTATALAATQTAQAAPPPTTPPLPTAPPPPTAPPRPLANGGANQVCDTATVVGSISRLAIQASTAINATTVGDVGVGGVVEVLCRDPVTADGRLWVWVRSQGVEGWMSTRYLQFSSRFPAEACSTGTVAGDISFLAINLETRRDSQQLGAVPVGGQVDVLCVPSIQDDEREWVMVRYQGVEGWMSTRYLQMVN